MRATFVRDDLEASPKMDPAYTEVRKILRNGRMQYVRFVKAGVTVKSPAAIAWISRGIAVPGDETTRAACLELGMDEADLRARQQRYERMSKGIQQDDWPLFDQGIITGYNPDGSYKPGPNWDQMPQETEDDDSEDE